MEIARLVDNGQGGFTFVGFPTSDDAVAVTWTQNTPKMGNGDIDEDTYAAVRAPASVGGWYLTVEAYNWVQNLGPDSWKATDGDGNTGDFTFVATDYTAQDTGKVASIKIEFYDGNPNTTPDITSGDFEIVEGIDDYDNVQGDVGRSWPTPLDSVAHGTLPPGNILTTYHKVQLTQDLQDIVDLNGKTWAPDPLAYPVQGWLYAVYYPDEVTVGAYNRDPNSEYIMYDDYMLQEGALVIFAIGDVDDWKLYSSYFPDVIYR
jgi:hypothetical protein